MFTPQWRLHEARVLLLVHGYRGVIVKALRRQHLGQLALAARRLFDLGPLVLEPDLDLILVQPELLREVLPPLLVEVAVLLKLPLQPAKLIRVEGRARPLVFGRGCLVVGRLGLLHFPQPRTCKLKRRNERESGSLSAQGEDEYKGVGIL